MAKFLSQVRFIAVAFALAFIVAMATPAPVSAQSGPTAATSEQQLLKQLKGGVIAGDVSIPDKNAANLIHPAGREWREFRTVTLKWIGGIAILGVLLAVVIFYMTRGVVEIDGGRSGRKIVRFNAFERFVHWLTASSFIVLGITGLNITFGRSLILPWLGPDAFSAWSEWGKVAHNYLGFAFTLGVVLTFLTWIGQNFPTAVDIEWFKRGGGLFNHTAVPSNKFNGGQKLLYWFVVLGGGTMIVSGFMLMFPFYYGMNVANMELAQIFHAIIAMLFVALIVGHIYIGTVGMEGAFEAMGEGTVDLNWAKEHHNLWVEDEMARGAADPKAMARPAE